MEFLASIRPDAIITDITPLIQDLSIVPSIPLSCVKLGQGTTTKKSNDNHPTTTVKTSDSVVYKAEKLYCICQGSASFTIYGPKPTKYALRELVRDRKPLLEDDISIRCNWMQRIDDASKAWNTTQQHDDLVNHKYHSTKDFIWNGTYHHCFRDYLGQEEIIVLARRHGLIDVLLFQAQSAGRIIIQNNSNCRHEAEATLLGFLPLHIWWEGVLNQMDHQRANIVWTKSTMRLGWAVGWNKTIERPPLAEKLRVAPWIIHPFNTQQQQQQQLNKTDILIVSRVGNGRLVYAKSSTILKL
jgi:hypothetical protein